MIATTRTEVRVTLELSQREALLLRALMNGMDLDEKGASTRKEAIVSVLRPGYDTFEEAEIVGIRDLISNLYASMSEVTR